MSREIDVGDNVFWILVVGVIVAGIVCFASVIANYNLQSNEQIKNAETCEKAVLLQGGADTTNRLIGCKIRIGNMDSTEVKNLAGSK